MDAELVEIYNDDCFNVFKDFDDNSIDLFVLDLPYGMTACKWDTPIDLEKMWVEVKRIMKNNAIICFFCTTKFGYNLIKSNEKWFKYDLIWKKSRKVGFLTANKRQLRNHENIYVFSDKDDDLEVNKHAEARNYSKQILDYTNKTLKEINKDLGHRKAEHFFYINSSQYSIPTKKIYNELVNMYELENMEGFLNYELLIKLCNNITTYNPQKIEGKEYKSKERIEGEGVYIKDSYKRTATKDTKNRHPTSVIEHENIYVFKDKQGTYNPQKTEGKPYVYAHVNASGTTTDFNNAYYKTTTKYKPVINKGDRHPTSVIEHENTILEYKSPSKSIHRTEKPVGLLEYLIKTYSNEGDVVMDFTMGSGSTGEACKNTNRYFIGIEKDEEIFNLAAERLIK